MSAVCGVSVYSPYQYVLVNEAKKWTESQSYCRQNYTDLATVNNMEEMKNLNTTLKDKTTSSVWIGLNRGSTERWLWSLADGVLLVNLTLPWKDALRYCREHHVDLVSVHSEEVQSWVMEVAQKASTDHVWLGLRHTCTLSFWFWVSGESICYQKWAPGNGTGGEDCGSGERSGAVESSGGQQWINSDLVGCRENHRDLVSVHSEEVQSWVMEIRSDQIRKPPLITFGWGYVTPTDRFCYLLVLGLCRVSAHVPYQYHFVNENKTWTEAQSYCRETHTDLATINNMEEMMNLNMTLKDKTTSSVWIGLQIGDTGRWLWSRADGDELVLVNQTLTWKEALRYCRENHMDLVSVHSKEVQSWVMEVAQKASTDHVWLGLRHTCTLSFWFWVSGESICYQNWAPGNGTGREDCGSGERSGAVESSGGQQWVSLPQNQQLNFICTNYEGILSFAFDSQEAWTWISAHVSWTLPGVFRRRFGSARTSAPSFSTWERTTSPPAAARS
ncbi:macrophage mannose receptor 1-like [Hoplias malabaricus]|uniref:macrophage mannose receptor 1-like n=1 Tax=Hoplias malabaricus TaxID=27720 RepID=UPI0034620989